MSVISIQSQVVYGHVGNSAAVFPMQMLGIDVMAVPTTLFSNRPRYPTTGGASSDADLVANLLLGLEERAQSILAKLSCPAISARRRLPGGCIRRPGNEKQPQLIYCCDPVIGVPAGVCLSSPAFRNSFGTGCARWGYRDAEIQFELEWLRNEDKRIEDQLGARRRDRWRVLGSSTVVVTPALTSE